MDPFTMALLGGGALMSAISSSSTNKANKKIAEANIAEQRADRLMRERLAERARAESHLGTTDAYGNRMYFDPVRGWVTDLTGDSEQIAEQQLNEQLRQLLVDAPQRRRAESANEAQRGDERAQADVFLDELRRTSRGDPERMRAMLYDRARMGIDEGYDDMSSTAITNALRTGNSNTGAIVAALAKSKGNDLRKASLDAAIQAEDRADARFNNQRSGVAQLYGAFADRASRLPQTAYQPTDVAGRTSGNISTFTNAAGNATNSLIDAFKTTPQMPYQQPDQSIGNFLTTAGSIYGQHQSDLRSDQRYADALDALKRRNTGSY